MIKLAENLVIIADEHQYIVGRPWERRAKAGNVSISIRDPRYYTTLSTALKSAMHTMLRSGVADGTICTLQDFIGEQQRLQGEFAKMLEAPSAQKE